MKFVILDGYSINPGDLSWGSLEDHGELAVFERTPKELVAQRIGNSDAVFTSKCVLSKEVLSQCPNLKYIGVLATGVNMVDLAYAHSRGIIVSNIPAYSTDSVAQFTFSLLFEICNHIGIHNEAVHAGSWQSSKDFCLCLTPQIELAGKTLGIIGKCVAKMAEAFGMKVLISTSYPDPYYANEGISFVSLDELFASSDIITLHCPLTQENTRLINKHTLGKMKDSVILLNTSRGPLIDEGALAEALKSGKVFAAGLDVLSIEPPIHDNPLIGLKNCIITPHIAWITRESRSRLIETAVSNLESWLAGEPINCVVL